MSSSKRRKLEEPNAPSVAVSAVSAIAARNRLNASPTGNDQPARPSTGQERVPISSPNSFNALRNLRSKPDHDVTPKRAGLTAAQNLTSHGPSATRPGTQKLDRNHSNSSVLETPASKVTPACSFRLTKRNHRARPDGVLELKLTNSERLLILGSYGIRIRSGEATVYGALLVPSDRIYWVFAAQCCAIPVIRTVENSHLEIHPNEKSWGLRNLQHLSPLFKGVWNGGEENKDKTEADRLPTFQLLFDVENASEKPLARPLVSPPEWNKKLASLAAQTKSGRSVVTLVCGPKAAGKSTFSRLLINRVLAMAPSPSPGVMLLDLDPGQPEYTPSGMVSLVHILEPNLGATFTHPELREASGRAVRCHTLASVTPATSPALYLEAATELFTTYRQHLPECCLVINTPGWILGTGLDLLTELIALIRPAEVVYMSEDGPFDTVEALREVTTGSFSVLPSQPSDFACRTAAQLRAMQTMSYFHLQVAKGHRQSRLEWNSSALSRLPPWMVRYSGPKQSIIGILCYDFQPEPELLAEAINGMVLSIVVIEKARAFRGLYKASVAGPEATEASEAGASAPASQGLSILRTPEDLPFIYNVDDISLDPQFSHAMGLALIRGIDTGSKCLQILSAVSSGAVEEARRRGLGIVLVHGRLDAPAWAYTEELYERSTGGGKEADVGNAAVDEDDGEASSDETPGYFEERMDISPTPWVEMLEANEKRPIGSKVWRVRRDLGRTQADSE